MGELNLCIFRKCSFDLFYFLGGYNWNRWQNKQGDIKQTPPITYLILKEQDIA